MESHCCASAASDHSESLASSHEQHCFQMPEHQVFCSTSSQGHPHHLSAHSHMLPQQSHMAVPQQYVPAAEQNVHHGQSRPRTPADYPAVCSAMTGDVSVHGQLISSIPLNTQTYSEVKSHQRHSNSHEPVAVYGNMSGLVQGPVQHSPKAMYQNAEGMVVAGHIPSEEGHVPQGGYYPVPHHGHHMQNSEQMSWQGRQYMSPGGQSAVPRQMFISAPQARFNSQASMPFRGQHPQYALNQEYGDVYCKQYHPVYCEQNSGSARGTFAPQQHCVGPNGQRIMFARHPMHVPRHRPNMPSDAQFVYYVPHSGSGPSQQPSWSGSTQVMRSCFSVGYSNQPTWQRSMAYNYGSERMPDYHSSSEPRMSAEFCENFGGARQHLSPSHSFSPGSVRYYRPPSNQEVHTGMVCADGQYAGSCHVLGDGNPNSTSASQEHVSTVLTSTVSSATMCSTVCSDDSFKDSVVLSHTAPPSHPLEHLPDGRTTLSHNSCTVGTSTAVSSQSLYSHAGHYLHSTSRSWPVSAAGDYYSYSAMPHYAQHHQHAGCHVNPYNYYGSPPRVLYSSTPHYPPPRCCHSYQSNAEEMQWQGQLAEHSVHEHRNTPANQHSVEHELPSNTAVATCWGSASVTSSALNVTSTVFSTSASVTSCKVYKENFDNTDDVNVTVTVALQSAATHVGHHMPFSGSNYPVKDHISPCSSVTRSLNCSPVTQGVVTAACAVVTLPVTAVHSTSVAVLKDELKTDVPPVSDKPTEDEVAITPEAELQNCLQITSSTLSDNFKSSKGSKRSSSRKANKKPKKKKTNVSLDTSEFHIDSAAVTTTDAVKNEAVKSMYFLSDDISSATVMKMAPAAESVNQLCPVAPEQTAVVVPYGWRRHVDSGTVVYYSPSNVCLRSPNEVRQYLLTDGTCKCGLQCPLVVDKTFVFNAQQTQSKHLLADDIYAASDRSNSLCNHRRKIIAVATFQQSTGFRFNKPETLSASRLSLPVSRAVDVAVVTSASEVASASGVPLSTEASASPSIRTIAHSFSSSLVSDSVARTSSITSQSTSGISQPHSSSHIVPGAVSSGEQCSAGPMMHMHYGSAALPAYGYSQMIVQHPRIMGQPPRAVYYHPSTDFQAMMSPSYHRMVRFPPHQMPYATSAGYAVYDRSAVHMASSPWSGNIHLPRQCVGMYGPPPQAVSTIAQRPAVDLPSTVPDAQEPLWAPMSTKTKKKSRAQSKELYSSILDRSVPCPNIDVRQIIQEQRERLQMETASCSASVSVSSQTAVWTMPATALHASSLSTSQHVIVSSQTLLATSAPLTASVYDGMTVTSSNVLFDLPDVCCTSLTMNTDVSVSSSQISSANTSTLGHILHTVTAVSSAKISPAVSHVTASFAEASVSTVCITAPMSTNVSCGASWVYTGTQPYSQYNHWSQYSNHPLSCSLATKSSVGMNLYPSSFECSQGHEVPGVLPYPGPQRGLSDMPAPDVAVATSIAANSASLSTDASLPLCSGSETGKDESPIRLVQNMVTGLETTQNSLALATSLIISQSESVLRRRKSGSTDAAGHIAASTAAVELSEEVRFSSKSLDVDGQTSSSVQLPDDSARCTQTKSHLPTTSTVTTVTSVLTQVLPAASVVPSAYCAHPLVSVSFHSSVSPLSTAAVSACSDSSLTINVTSTLCTNVVEPIASSGTADGDTDAECYNADTAFTSDGITAPPLTNSQVVDDDESTQDCDISIAGTDSGEVLCTTGTQTSTPTSAMFNCNSIESGVDGSESNDTLPESQSDVVTGNVPVPALRPSSAYGDKPPDDILTEHVPVSTSTPVVFIPRVPQASFLLPQNIAFAPNPLVGHGFLQFQPPSEFGYGAAVQSSGSSAVAQPGALGLVHFAAGPMVGPPVGNVMTTSDAGGSFRLMTPVKSDSDGYGAAEFLPIVHTPVAAGHILLQNIVPTGLASTIVPFMQPAALCSLPGGSSALFAVSQGSMMPVATPLAFASVPMTEQQHQPRDHAPDQPDSTVDNSEMDTTDEPSSDDSTETEQVTSTDEPLDEIYDQPTNSATKLASSSASKLHCSTSHSTPTKTTECSTLESGSSTSVRMEYDSRHSVEIAGTSSASQSTAIQLPRPLIAKKRAQHGGSRLKKKLHRRYGHSMLSGAAADQMSCSSSLSGLTVPASAVVSSIQDMHDVDALTSPAGSDEFTDLLPSNFSIKDTAASDSSVSTTLSLHDSSNDGIDLSTDDKRSHAGAFQKVRWKKRQALARRTRGLPLRHSKHEVKQPADTQLSTTDFSHVEDVADSTTGSAPTVSPRTFNVGDLVWGPSRGFPSWPGKLVADSEVRGNHKLESGKIWVKWFGDHSFAQADPGQLKTLSEGLETHHNARKKDRQGRKMNSNLEAAIQEAMTELDRQMAEQSAVRSSSSTERSQKSNDGKKRK